MNLTSPILLLLAFAFNVALLASEGPMLDQMKLAKILQTKIDEEKEEQNEVLKNIYYEYPGTSGKVFLLNNSGTQEKVTCRCLVDCQCP